MQRKPAESLRVCHTFKVGSRLGPDTFWIYFRTGECLKEPGSDSYDFAMAQRKMTKVIFTNLNIEEGMGLEEYQDVGEKEEEEDDVEKEGIKEEELVSSQNMEHSVIVVAPRHCV
jgi:hypothetical protein